MRTERYGSPADTGPGREERGATLVEYVLVLSLVVVVAIPAIAHLSDRSSGEVANQADCVSTRPPPESCQLPAVAPPPDPGGDGDGPPPQPTVPDGCEGDDCPPAPEVDFGAEAVETSADPGSPWNVRSTLTIEVEDAAGDATAVEGAQVTFEYQVTDPPTTEVFHAGCVTGAGGSCTHDFDVPYADAQRVRVRVVRITSDPVVDEDRYPADVEVGAP